MTFSAASPINGPTNLDPEWIHANMGGPPHVHGSFPKMFGAPTSESDRPDVAARINEMSPIEHVTADDPPTLLLYTGKLEGIPLPETASTGVLIHHAYFGKVLRERLEELRISNELHLGFNPRQPKQQQIILNWLDKYLNGSKSHELTIERQP
ncbi:MAG: hypothetical protein ACQESR_29040 [Planctomycetota bacterium]